MGAVGGEAPREGEELKLALPEKKGAAARKPRVDCIDGCRFALVLPIVVGHFARFATKRPVLLKLLTQENVLVGGFFLISGYVAGYVGTLLNKQSCDKKKLADPELYFWQKVMSYYPLHLLVSTAFSPMFVLAERWAKMHWRGTGLRALLNFSLLQAWFPSEAESWNPPTWFLSALTFANAAMPSIVLPQVAALSKPGLRKLVWGLGALTALQKVSYSQAWQFHCRGAYRCRTTTPHLWNVTRFHPIWALAEMTMGVAAAREVMLDREGEAKPAASPLLLFLASHATLALRLTRLNLNDALVRSTLFVPLYLRFLQALHRDSLAEKPSAITRFFSSPMMTRLGALAFPMFVVHGPLGQLFYKKAVATRLWGRVLPERSFPLYLLLVLACSHLLNEAFVKSKTVQRLSSAAAKRLARATEGMLRDPLARKGSYSDLAAL